MTRREDERVGKSGYLMNEILQLIIKKWMSVTRGCNCFYIATNFYLESPLYFIGMVHRRLYLKISSLNLKPLPHWLANSPL